MDLIKISLKKYFFFFILLILLIIISEITSYLIWNNYFVDLRHAGVYRVKEIIGDTSSLNHTKTYISHPYTLFTNNPNFIDNEFGKQYDTNGYRSPEYREKENEFKVLILGGSTTNSYPFVKNPKKIWTYKLQEFLEKKMKRPVHIFNAGVPNANSAELLIHYLLKGKFLNPHLLVYHGGLNDIAPGIYPNFHTDYSHYRFSTTRAARRFEKFLLTNFQTPKLIYSVWLRSVGGIFNTVFDISELSRDYANKIIDQYKAVAFNNNISIMSRESINHGTKVLFVGALQAKEKLISKNRPDLKGLEKVYVKGVEIHDKIMNDVANKYDQHFLQLDKEKFQDEWFLDNAHLNEAGEYEKAKQIFKYISKNIL